MDHHFNKEHLKRAMQKTSRWVLFEREIAHFLQTEKNMPANITSDHLVSFLTLVQNLKTTERQILHTKMRIINELSRQAPK